MSEVAILKRLRKIARSWSSLTLTDFTSKYRRQKMKNDSNYDGSCQNMSVFYDRNDSRELMMKSIDSVSSWPMLITRSMNYFQCIPLSG